jgi:hypothetical protein
MKMPTRLSTPALAAIVVAGLAASGMALAVSTHAVRLPWQQPALAVARAEAHYQPIRWVKLMPEEWLKRFRELGYGQVNDGDPRVKELLDAVEKTWDTAPTVASLDGLDVKLPGYIVPLEEKDGALTEFLLVPYLGACIHTPPPPANQIVHVRSGTPLKGLHAMDIVSISGTLKVTTERSTMGVSGYAMDAVRVEPFVMPARHAQGKGGDARTASVASKTDRS